MSPSLTPQYPPILTAKPSPAAATQGKNCGKSSLQLSYSALVFVFCYPQQFLQMRLEAHKTNFSSVVFVVFVVYVALSANELRELGSVLCILDGPVPQFFCHIFPH